jgi:hypothetical protein
MTGMDLIRGNSQDIVPVTMRWSRGGQPTERWQDKSREVRGGRSGGEGASSRLDARCAPSRDSLPNRVSLWRCMSERTSHIGAA